MIQDLFGGKKTDAKRNMSDFFGVAPFSILNTVDGDWQLRKKRWNNLVNDRGQAREGVLGDKDGMMGKISSGTSILDGVLAELMVKWFTEKGFESFDPFAGDTVFGFISAFMGRPFTGIELRPEQAEFNQKQCDSHNLQAKYICDTSENMDKYIKNESKDFIFSCPPYADLEVYSDLPQDLSNMSHEDFFKIYKKVLQKNLITKKSYQFCVA